MGDVHEVGAPKIIVGVIDAKILAAGSRRNVGVEMWRGMAMMRR